MAVYYGLFAVCVWRLVFCAVREKITKFFYNALIFIPLLGVITEYMRAEVPFLGFGWNLLGYSQVSNPIVLQCARICGVYGLTWIIMVINVLLFLILWCSFSGKRLFGRQMVFVVMLCAVMAGVIGYGKVCLRYTDETQTFRIAVVQPNIAQQHKWNPALKELIVEKNNKLIHIAYYNRPDLIVLPEAAYPGNLMREFAGSSLAQLSRDDNVPIIVGAPYVPDTTHIFNSAYFIENGTIAGIHNKLKLVPFGEFIPFKPFFAFLGLDKVAYSLGVGDFMEGDTYTVFDIPRSNLRAGVLVCFEDTWPSLSRNFIKHGANVLINITNDAWFGQSSASYQHMQASILRAVENGCYVIRAANTGISGFISSTGEVLDIVADKESGSIYTAGSAVYPVPSTGKRTFYQRFGYLFPYVVIGIFVCTLFGQVTIFRKK